jgi:outer membrane protein assembly factor BamA
MSRVWLLAIVLACAGMAEAQLPPCFRSKYTHEWPINVAHVALLDGNKLARRDKASIVRELKRQCDCWPCALSDDVSDQIREMYQWFGYFQAVAEVDIKKLSIDAYSVTAHVQEGPQYHLGEIDFSSVKGFAPEELRKLFPLEPGDLFDTRRFRHGLDNLRQLYATKGYLNFTAVPETKADPANGTISVRIDIDEGPVFRLGPLLLVGMDQPRGFAKKLQDQWRPHVGEVYNSSFVDGFITQNFSGVENKLHITYLQDAKAGTVAVRIGPR